MGGTYFGELAEREDAEQGGLAACAVSHDDDFAFYDFSRGHGLLKRRRRRSWWWCAEGGMLFVVLLLVGRSVRHPAVARPYSHTPKRCYI